MNGHYSALGSGRQALRNPDFRSRSERASLKAPAPQGNREKDPVGITVGSLRGVIRENGGLRRPVNLSGQVRIESDSTQFPVAAAQRIGTADGSGDGSSVRTDPLRQVKVEGVA